MAAGWGVNLGEGSKVIHLKFLFIDNEHSGTQFSVIQFLYKYVYIDERFFLYNCLYHWHINR